MNDDKHVGYDFVQLGEGLASALLRAAEEQVQRAHQVLDQTKSLAEILRTQVAAQAQQIEEMNARFKVFGSHMLEAHRHLNGEAELLAPVVESPNEELLRLRNMAKLRAIGPAGASP